MFLVFCACRRKARDVKPTRQPAAAAAGGCPAAADPDDTAAAGRDTAAGSSSGGSSDCDSLDDEGAFEKRRPSTRSQRQQDLAKTTPATATAAAGRGAQGRALSISVQQRQQQREMLLLPSFKASTAWQYSSSNLLRVCQSGSSCSTGGKARFKQVVKPQGLLKKARVPLDQLGFGVVSIQVCCCI